MRQRTTLTTISFLVFFLVNSCGLRGSFCDLGERLEVKNRDSAVYLLEHERALLITMNVQNKMLDLCGKKGM